MAREPLREREVEEDRATNKAGVVMVGGMDNLQANADQPLKVEIRDADRPERRVVANVERDDREEESRDRDREDDSRLAYDLDGEGLDERRSRRARRNRSRRDAIDSRDQHIMALTQRLEQLGGVVQSLTQGQTGLTIGTIDNQLLAAQQALTLADDELARAVSTQDGAKFREVQRIRDEAAARVFQLSNTKNGIINEQRRQASASGGPPRIVQPPGLNARAQDMAEVFMSRFPYYDPSGTDEDTMVIKAIDDAVMAEGFRPDTSMYWRTLEQRLAQRGFYPATGEDEDERRDDRRFERRERPPRSNSFGGLPPSSGSLGSGRRRNGTDTFTIPAMAREYLEGEGLLQDNLTDQQKARRDRLIRNWRDYDRRAKAGEFART
jgi:hypothetical protein